MNKSETIAKLTTALCQAQAEIKGAHKDSNNPFFNSTYADLSSVWDACREPLLKHGLCVIQAMDIADTGVVIETILCHVSGEWISGRLKMVPVKNDPQGIGSAITYGRRYALAAMVGVAPEDDDGEGAMGRIKDAPKKGDGRPVSGLPAKASADEPPADVRETLKKELFDYCDGNAIIMAKTLRDISIFGESGKENWIKNINDRVSEKWCGKALANLRKLVVEVPPDNNDDVPF